MHARVEKISCSRELAVSLTHEMHIDSSVEPATSTHVPAYHVDLILAHGHTAGMHRKLVMFGADDCKVRVVQRDGWQEMFRIDCHTDYVRAVAFTQGSRGVRVCAMCVFVTAWSGWALGWAQ